MDHLSEAEGLVDVTWVDQERGLQHHFAILFPCLNAAGKREFESALERLAGRQSSISVRFQLGVVPLGSPGAWAETTRWT